MDAPGLQALLANFALTSTNKIRCLAVARAKIFIPAIRSPNEPHHRLIGNPNADSVANSAAARCFPSVS